MAKVAVIVSFTAIFLLQKGYAQFTNVNEEVGIDHHHEVNTLMGGGALFFDYNNDGWLDLYLTGGTSRDGLFQNNSDGTFTDVSEGSFVDHYTNESYTFGVSAGDYNNDGCQDIFVATFEKDERNILLRNNCDGTFTNVAFEVDLLETTSSTGGVFLDFNNDGWLDLYVINYIDNFDLTIDENGVLGFEYQCLSNHFYINVDGQYFIEVSDEYDVSDNGCGLAIQATDYDLDSDQDIYVANDHGYFVTPNVLYKNEYPSASFERYDSEGINVGFFAMGIASSDYDNDGDLDYYVTNLGENAFLQGTGTEYLEIARDLGVENGFNEDSTYVTGWGTNFFDYNLDGDEDLFVSNGYVKSGYFGITTRFEDYNKFYENEGGLFTDRSDELGLSNPDINRGSAVGDYDNDGDLDLVVVAAGNTDERTVLYRNDQATANNFVGFHLEGTEVSRDAYGSLVRVYSGGSRWIREKYSSSSHASQSTPILNVGVGTSTMIDSITVTWQGATISTYYNLETNKTYFIKQGSSEVQVMGCMNSSSSNFDPSATFSYGCEFDVVLGCTMPSDPNHKTEANTIDGTCASEPIILAISSGMHQVQVYPTPTTDILNIDVPNRSWTLEYSLWSVEGREVLSNSGYDPLDISHLRNGVYILKGSYRQEEFVFRIIKK